MRSFQFVKLTEKETWVYKIVNYIGILKTVPYMKNMLNFTGSVLMNHKSKHIDGNCTFSIAMFFFKNKYRC